MEEVTIDPQNLIHVSWDQFGLMVEKLAKNLKEYLGKNQLQIDVIVPILREGGFTGLTLAYKLNTYKILPIQFKYLLHNGGSELKQISKLPEVMFEIPPHPTILLCDTFPAGGKTKLLAAEEIRVKFPEGKIIFASIFGDPSAKSNFLANICAINVDGRGITHDELAQKMGIENTMNVILPWENPDEEIASVQEKEYTYN